MATRSRIGYLNKNNEWHSIYCHFDGYLEGVGMTLFKHYNEIDKIKELLSLGSISQLRREIHPLNNITHTFETPDINTTIFYGRDRGDIDLNYEIIKIDKIIKEKFYEEFNYIFINNIWFYFLGYENEIKLEILSKEFNK